MLLSYTHIEDDQIQVAFQDRALIGVIIVQEIVLGIVINDDVLNGGWFL
jgi:hypothetical protein